jgi:hypothetical protein
MQSSCVRAVGCSRRGPRPALPFRPCSVIAKCSPSPQRKTDFRNVLARSRGANLSDSVLPDRSGHAWHVRDCGTVVVRIGGGRHAAVDSRCALSWREAPLVGERVMACLRPALYSSLRSSPSHPAGVSALRVTIAIASARFARKSRRVPRVWPLGWALGTSDRGGQDKSRKVRTVGSMRSSSKFKPASNIATSSCTPPFLARHCRRCDLDTLWSDR